MKALKCNDGAVIESLLGQCSLGDVVRNLDPPSDNTALYRRISSPAGRRPTLRSGKVSLHSAASTLIARFPNPGRLVPFGFCIQYSCGVGMSLCRDACPEKRLRLWPRC